MDQYAHYRHEVYGGADDEAIAYLGSLDAKSKAKGGRDVTEYHDPPGKHRLSWREHWGRKLSAAAALGDATRVAARRTRVREAAARADIGA